MRRAVGFTLLVFFCCVVGYGCFVQQVEVRDDERVTVVKGRELIERTIRQEIVYDTAAGGYRFSERARPSGERARTDAETVPEKSAPECPT